MQKKKTQFFSPSILSQNTQLIFLKPLRNSSYMENKDQLEQLEVGKVELSQREEKNIKNFHVCYQRDKT